MFIYQTLKLFSKYKFLSFQTLQQHFEQTTLKCEDYCAGFYNSVLGNISL